MSKIQRKRTIEPRLGANIRGRRDAANMSQTVLAVAMNNAMHPTWSRATVSAVEAGRRSVTVDELGSLVFILGPGILTGTHLARVLDAERRAI